MARQRATTPKQSKTAAPAKTSRTAKKATPAKAQTAGAGATQPVAAPVSAGGETRTKFTLYNLLGKERAYYLVDRMEVERPKK